VRYMMGTHRLPVWKLGAQDLVVRLGNVGHDENPDTACLDVPDEAEKILVRLKRRVASSKACATTAPGPRLHTISVQPQVRRTAE
jgi:hypothetical protein